MFEGRCTENEGDSFVLIALEVLVGRCVTLYTKTSMFVLFDRITSVLRRSPLESVSCSTVGRL